MTTIVDHASAVAWATEELSRLVGIRSYSCQEHEVMQYVRLRAEELGFPTRVLPVEGAGPNVLVGWSSEPVLLLTAHLDTIVPTWDWDGSATVQGTIVSGLGAQDDKSGAVACLLAFVLAREEGVDLASRPVAIAFCSDEEVGGRGSRTLAPALRPRYVVALEGTAMNLGLAEAGMLDVQIRVRGKTVHGALREEGDNAIAKAARLICEIDLLPFTRRRHPLLGASMPSVEELHGGGPLNAVPDLAELRLSVRLLPGLAVDEVVAELRDLCGRHDAELTVLASADPYETSPRAALPRALAAAREATLGEAPEAVGIPAITDGHSFVELAGSETVVFGPGHLRNSHRQDEHIDVRDVVDCARVLARLVGAMELADGASSGD